MKITALSLAVAGALAAPAFAQAGEVKLTTTLKDFRGNDAYLAIYLTDAQGKYQRTLWVAGKKAKYYKHLGDWARGSGMNRAEFDGMSGASVGAGETLTVTAQVADNLIDAGYQIRIDSAVENHDENRAEVKVPLTHEGSGKETAGSGYVSNFRYDL
ncbi:DUF2271 domain-containing protein [Pseudomonas panipatensis]|jgi:hypothetical protein|uniref:Tat (Twin-arginine translocation) pathway signal sequence n=1 Tax=Pseudomonas panipatensis TaxID=428992 RepID=A0A1G8L2L1_9PSED|nr:DUF2271 domain-containing protein [Pseudomonas panipatensis]SDI49878.1 Predicted protein [Pseudomonas panipatensis]SMP72657.1 Predicted protein [Pseudomonas panipatensis]